MIKTTTTALVAAAMLISSSTFAGDKACCVKGVSNTDKTACVDLATLNLTPDQKAKIEAWQAECMAGRLHEGKSANVPEASQRNSLRGAVRSTKSTVQKIREREED